MIEINLLPSEIVKQRKRRDFIIFVGICAVVGLSICIYIYANLNQSIYPLENNLAELTAKIEEYQPILKQIANIREENSKLQGYFNTLKQVSAKQSFWPEVLYDVYRSLPDTIWLEEIKSDAKQSLMEVKGISLNKTMGVAEFVKNLERSKFFSEVQFTKFSRQEMFEKQVMFFQLRCFMSKE